MNRLQQGLRGKSRLLAAAIVIPALFIACMKAGDGVGLTAGGALIKPNPCIANPASAGCVVDSCALPNPPARCLAVDSCLLPNPPARCAVPDSCALPNPPARCVAVDSCLLPNPPSRCIDCSRLPKPVECLDRAFFTANVLPIFKTHCEKCHIKPGGTGFMQTRLTLESGAAWDSLVNIKSIEMLTVKNINMMRVLPGVPDSSYLFLKIFKATPPYGVRMPAEAAAPLSDEDIQTIKTWITGRN
ncbi:MAG: hypothetical protein ABIW76_10340 [Fibrobacteria bacterium]